MTNHSYPSSYGDRGYSSKYSSFNYYRGQWGYNTGPLTPSSVTGPSRPKFSILKSTNWEFWTYYSLTNLLT